MKAVMFPGQGSQFKGMGKNLFDSYRKEVDLASSILGYDLKELCLKDPKRELGQTQFTQPALYVVNALGYLEQQEKENPDYLIGHSLGEYNALLAAGAFSFETGLRLVQKRGELMAKASGGTMAAVLGIDILELKEKLKNGGFQDIDIANCNTFSQTVVAGPESSVAKLIKRFGIEGIKIIPLNVSAPFHSRYMQPAAEEFEKFIQNFDFSPLNIPVISNVTAKKYADGEVKKLLGQQIVGTVEWTESLLQLMKKGVTNFHEIGGGILTKMVDSVKAKSDIKVVSQAQKVKLPKKTVEKKPLSFRPSMQLGSKSFRDDYDVQFTYLAGSMHNGIASKELVVRMAQSGMLAFLGTKSLSIQSIRENLEWIKNELPEGSSFGVNLFQTNDIRLEQEIIELYLMLDVENVETTGFVNATNALVQYRLNGLIEDSSGNVKCKNRIIAKVSRPEEAELFMRPAPYNIVEQLLEQNLVTEKQAELSRKVPMSFDICAEADSGWNTNREMGSVLLPSIMELRQEIQKSLGYKKNIRVGLAGGIGTPQAVASAYVMGADFILTGSINQCTVEAGTSDAVKDLLLKMDVQDTDYAPASDLFEIGGQAQVLRKGVMFSARANKLYQLYKRYDGLDDIPQKTVQKLEADYFGKSLEAVWNEIVGDKKSEHETFSAVKMIPKEKMAHVFRWYFEKSTSLAIAGDSMDKENFQIHTGSSLGAFNQWAKNTALKDWRNRHVDRIGIDLMDAAVLLLKRKYV